MILFAPLPLVQISDPSTDLAWVVAVAKLPELGARDRAALDVLARVLPKQTAEYARPEMMTVTDGRTVQCRALSDCIYIRFAVPKGNEKDGLNMLDALLRRSTLADEQIEKAKAALGATDRGYWQIALSPSFLDYSQVKKDDVVNLYKRVFAPELTQVAIASSSAETSYADHWDTKIEGWTATKPPRFPDDTPFTQVEYGPTGVTLCELAGAESPSTDVTLSSKLLALTALGSGKGSSLHRIIRERHGWSYRQEPVLWPTVKGWQSRLVFPMKNCPNAQQRAETVQKEILEDISAWTEADRTRALSILEGSLTRGLNLCPLACGPQGSPGLDLADRSFMAAYWSLKTGRSWNPASMVSSAGMVSLADLKDLATQMVSQMKPRVIVGR